MKSDAKVYQTKAGKDLINSLHYDYYDALEATESMIEALEKAYNVATGQEKNELLNHLNNLVMALDKIRSLEHLQEDEIL